MMCLSMKRDRDDSNQMNVSSLFARFRVGSCLRSEELDSRREGFQFKEEQWNGTLCIFLADVGTRER